MVVVSVPERAADAVLRPSPLIADLPQVDRSALIQAAPRSYREQLQREHVGALIRFADALGPPLCPSESVLGGTAIVKSQAACPFQAFARYRLGAAALERPDVGLDSRARGALVHTVLDHLWGRLQDHAHLAGLDEGSRGRLVSDCIRGVIQAQAAKHPELFTARFSALEAGRLNQLMTRWLEIEIGRTPFSVVARETAHEVVLGPLRLGTRADRVDRLQDGRRVLIDYKTGEADPNDWLGPRPDEPQLPLYSLHNHDRLGAYCLRV